MDGKERIQGKDKNLSGYDSLKEDIKQLIIRVTNLLEIERKLSFY